MAHNEDSRVKIPALIHFTRLGYEYFSLKDLNYEIDWETNIIKNIFRDQFLKINKMSDQSEDDLRTFENEFKNILLELWQDDLWREFHNRLLGEWNSDYQIIDWRWRVSNSCPKSKILIYYHHSLDLIINDLVSRQTTIDVNVFTAHRQAVCEGLRSPIVFTTCL